MVGMGQSPKERSQHQHGARLRIAFRSKFAGPCGISSDSDVESDSLLISLLSTRSKQTDSLLIRGDSDGRLFHFSRGRIRAKMLFND